MEKYPEDTYVPQMKKDINRLQIIADRFQKIGSETELNEMDFIPVVEEAIAYIRVRTSNKITIEDSAIKGIKRVVALNAPLMQWVIENILKNALDAIQNEGKITITICENEHDVMLDITDNGKGMDSKTQRHIFDAGYTTKERGWGLGLPLAKRIVEQYHGGKLLLKHTQQGIGSTFRIVLKKPENS